MKLTHDPKRNVAYLRFKDEAAEVETLHISDELNVDIAPDGSIYGIELLNANAQLSASGFPGANIYRDASGRYRVSYTAGESEWTAGPFADRREAEDAVTALFQSAVARSLSAA